MRLLIFTLIGLFAIDNLSAQDKIQEVGLSFNDLNRYGLTYRIGHYKSVWRFNAMITQGNNTENLRDSLEYNNVYFDFNLSLGKEFRRELTEKLEVRYGININAGVFSFKNETDDKSISDLDFLTKRKTWLRGISVVFGFNYLLSEHFLLGAEILPKFNYITGTETNSFDSFEEKSKIKVINYGFSSQSAVISLVYRFKGID